MKDDEGYYSRDTDEDLALGAYMKGKKSCYSEGSEEEANYGSPDDGRAGSTCPDDGRTSDGTRGGSGDDHGRPGDNNRGREKKMLKRKRTDSKNSVSSVSSNDEEVKEFLQFYDFLEKNGYLN